MKIYLIFKIKEAPTGGGNQFLRNLKQFLVENDLFTEKIEDASIFLFNSYQFIPETISLKRCFPNKIFIHRIDGPIKLYSKTEDNRDLIIYKSNRFIADGTIFQSKWSKKMNYFMGLKACKFESIIMNAPDHKLFNTNNFKRKHLKIKLIAISWSSNLNKGFEDYKWLDSNLDFDKIEMTFIGNTIIKFKHIKHIPPLQTTEISKELKNHDIFISASRSDPCSNALLEAMHCGLPAIALNAGGHPEIIRNGGELFDSIQEVPYLITKIFNNYNYYQDHIILPDMIQIGNQYLSFINEIYSLCINKQYTPKKISKYHQFILNRDFFYWRLFDKISNLYKQ